MALEMSDALLGSPSRPRSRARVLFGISKTMPCKRSLSISSRIRESRLNYIISDCEEIKAELRIDQEPNCFGRYMIERKE